MTILATSFVSSILVLAFGAMTTAMAAYAGKRPNILLVVADDMGWSDLGSYWSDMFGMSAEQEEIAEYVLDDKRLDELPIDFYATRSYSDFLIESV